MYVSLATSYTQGPVPALTHINLATEKVLCSHVCPLLCFGVHWFMSSHGKPKCRSCKQDSKRKREDMCFWVDMINWESHKCRCFNLSFFLLSPFSAFQFPLLFFLKQLSFHPTFSGTVTQIHSERSPKNYFSIGTPSTLTCSFPQRLTNF